jgi:hypothetical protein
MVSALMPETLFYSLRLLAAGCIPRRESLLRLVDQGEEGAADLVVPSEERGRPTVPSQPGWPSSPELTSGAISDRAAATVASKRFRFVPNSRKMYGCEIPMSRADLLRWCARTHAQRTRRRFEHGFPPLRRRQSGHRGHLRIRALGTRRAR